MSLRLAIEASSATYAVALGAPDVPYTERSCRRDDPSFESIGGMVASLLDSVDGKFDRIELIGVDVGPGNLSSVRSAVAYANGLAFSLGVEVLPVTSFELMAAEVGESGPGPVLCMRKGEGGNAYGGLFLDGEVAEMRYGPLSAIVPEMVGDMAEVWVAGAHRHDVAGLLPGVAVYDTGMDTPSVLALYRTLVAQGVDIRPVPFASPVNEASKIFHERPTRFRSAVGR